MSSIRCSSPFPDFVVEGGLVVRSNSDINGKTAVLRHMLGTSVDERHLERNGGANVCVHTSVSLEFTSHFNIFPIL